MAKPVIFTDIDGTLLNRETYSYAEVEKVVSDLITHRIPLVLCSSKTRAEQESLRAALHIPDPYIVENGSAIFVPEGYFDGGAPSVIELGVTAVAVREAIGEIRQKTGLLFRGYGDLTVAEVSEITGLDESAAAKTKQRDFSETIVTPLTQAALLRLRAAFAGYGLTIVSGGKFYTITSASCDKGKAVVRLSHLLQRKCGDIVTIGLGDSANDASLLAAVDRPFLVQRPDGRWHDMGALAVTKVPAVGPYGWRQVVQSFVKAHSSGA